MIHCFVYRKVLYHFDNPENLPCGKWMAWRREEAHPDSQDGGDGDSLVLGKRPHFPGGNHTQSWHTFAVY